MKRRFAITLLIAGTAAGITIGHHFRKRFAPHSKQTHTTDLSNDYVVRADTIMATRIEALVPRQQAQASKIVFKIFRQVDAQMSEWKSSSPLTAVNRAAGISSITVPDDLRAVIKTGLALGTLSDGAFDITWAALWGLWDFKAPIPNIPAAAEIERRRQLVNYKDVVIDDEAKTVFLRKKGMLIGLGGIAKGFALNVSAQRLREAGVTSFMLSSGGQILVGGRKGSRPWRIGIRAPRGAPTDYLLTLQLEDISVSTSGDYERFFVRDGVRYHHVLDPRTGMPTHGPQSVTVVCTDAMRADALSTAVMVLGRKAGLALIERLDKTEAVVVDQDGTIHMSTNAGRYVAKTADNQQM